MLQSSSVSDVWYMQGLFSYYSIATVVSLLSHGLLSWPVNWILGQCAFLHVVRPIQ